MRKQESLTRKTKAPEVGVFTPFGRFANRMLHDAHLIAAPKAQGEVSGWMSQIIEEGYASRSISKPFELLKQVMRYPFHTYPVERPAPTFSILPCAKSP